MNSLGWIHHLSIVVRDLEVTCARYAEMGIGPWSAYPPLPPYAEFEGMDQAVQFNMKAKFALVENMLIQLCQPGPEDSPQRRFLESRGEGVFYLGFGVPDCDVAEAEIREVGLPILVRGRRPDGGGFTLFDSAESTGGVHLQISRKAPSS